MFLSFDIGTLAWECRMRYLFFPPFFPPGRADDSLGSRGGSRGVPGQEHVSQKRLQGKKKMQHAIPNLLNNNTLTSAILFVMSSWSLGRSSSISEGTRRKGISCRPEPLPEFPLPSELLSVRRLHASRLVY